MDVEIPVSQFPLSVIAIFICRVLIWLVFQFFLGVIVNSSCDTEEELNLFFLNLHIHIYRILNHFKSFLIFSKFTYTYLSYSKPFQIFPYIFEYTDAK